MERKNETTALISNLREQMLGAQDKEQGEPQHFGLPVRREANGGTYDETSSPRSLDEAVVEAVAHNMDQHGRCRAAGSESIALRIQSKLGGLSDDGTVEMIKSAIAAGLVEDCWPGECPGYALTDAGRELAVERTWLEEQRQGARPLNGSVLDAISHHPLKNQAPVDYVETRLMTELNITDVSAAALVNEAISAGLVEASTKDNEPTIDMTPAGLNLATERGWAGDGPHWIEITPTSAPDKKKATKKATKKAPKKSAKKATKKATKKASKKGIAAAAESAEPATRWGDMKPGTFARSPSGRIRLVVQQGDKATRVLRLSYEMTMGTMRPGSPSKWTRASEKPAGLCFPATFGDVKKNCDDGFIAALAIRVNSRGRGGISRLFVPSLLAAEICRNLGQDPPGRWAQRVEAQRLEDEQTSKDIAEDAEYRARLDADHRAELDARHDAKIAEQDAVNEAIAATPADDVDKIGRSRLTGRVVLVNGRAPTQEERDADDATLSQADEGPDTFGNQQPGTLVTTIRGRFRYVYDVTDKVARVAYQKSDGTWHRGTEKLQAKCLVPKETLSDFIDREAMMAVVPAPKAEKPPVPAAVPSPATAPVAPAAKPSAAAQSDEMADLIEMGRRLHENNVALEQRVAAQDRRIRELERRLDATLDTLSKVTAAALSLRHIDSPGF